MNFINLREVEKVYEFLHHKFEESHELTKKIQNFFFKSIILPYLISSNLFFFFYRISSITNYRI